MTASLHYMSQEERKKASIRQLAGLPAHDMFEVGAPWDCLVAATIAFLSWNSLNVQEGILWQVAPHLLVA